MSKGNCKAEACSKEVVGKGYCQRHYHMWKQGKLAKPRYKTCVEDGCKGPQVAGARCETHRKDKKAEAAAPAA